MMADHHETNVSITIEDPRTKGVFIVDPSKIIERQAINHGDQSVYDVSICPILETTNEGSHGYQKSHHQSRRSGILKW